MATELVRTVLMIPAIWRAGNAYDGDTLTNGRTLIPKPLAVGGDRDYYGFGMYARTRTRGHEGILVAWDLRMMHVNTPEIGRNGAQSQTGALECRDKLAGLIAGLLEIPVMLLPRFDNYHRALFEMTLPGGVNVNSVMREFAAQFQPQPRGFDEIS